ncbi:hypothetical protein RvY_08162 [Ramazzottius varieornatus]|uniref:Uncharacterized protein n=1 Tax=Ramazzottius varieornatus TaxID=947166 RepID=A0A1D1V788_RAMVA|nr:hypothetical protein RvY_08162 [Ramazzottius varieornatus]
MGRPSSQRSRLSITPQPSANRPAPNFEEDLTLLAQYAEDYRELITNKQLYDGLAEGKMQLLYGIQGVFVRHCLERQEVATDRSLRYGRAVAKECALVVTLSF